MKPLHSPTSVLCFLQRPFQSFLMHAPVVARVGAAGGRRSPALSQPRAGGLDPVKTARRLVWGMLLALVIILVSYSWDFSGSRRPINSGSKSSNPIIRRHQELEGGSGAAHRIEGHLPKGFYELRASSQKSGGVRGASSPAVASYRGLVDSSRMGLEQCYPAEWLPERMAPSFFIIGVQKSGSTWLYKVLAQHKQLAPPSVKEIFYFDSRIGKEGLHKYMDYFPLKKQQSSAAGGAAGESGNAHPVTPCLLQAGPAGSANAADCGRMSFEATMTYSYFPHTPVNLQRHFPCAKLVVVLRDPVHRWWSGFQMDLRRGLLPADTDPVTHAEYSVKAARALISKVSRIPELSEIEEATQTRNSTWDAGRRNTFWNVHWPADDPYTYRSFYSRPRFPGLEPSVPIDLVMKGLYSEQLDYWAQFFPQSSFLVLEGEQLLSKGDGSKEAQAPALALSSVPEGIPEERRASTPSAAAYATKGGFQASMDAFADFLGLSPLQWQRLDSFVLPYGGGKHKKPGDYGRIPAKAEEVLRAFYEPYMRLLKRNWGVDYTAEGARLREAAGGQQAGGEE